MHRLVNFFWLAQVSIPFLKKYYAYHLIPKTKGALYNHWRELKNEVPDLEILDKTLEKRIYHYLFANSLTTQWFCTLHDYRPSMSELKRGRYLGVSTPIADFLVDQEKLGAAEIHNMIRKVSSHPWKNMVGRLFEKATENHPNSELCEELIFLTLSAQHASLQQKESNLTGEKLKEITWNKGGFALLLYRSALDIPIGEKEWEAIFQLGGLMQLHNDIFDLYRDLQEGIITLATHTESISQLTERFRDEINITKEMFGLLNVPSNSKHKFYLLLTLAVQTGYHALQQYAKLEERDGFLNLSQYTREQLVCDMDNFSKVARTVWVTLSSRY